MNGPRRSPVVRQTHFRCARHAQICAVYAARVCDKLISIVRIPRHLSVLLGWSGVLDEMIRFADWIAQPNATSFGLHLAIAKIVACALCNQARLFINCPERQD
jgi:hypothetical protein